MLTIDGKTLMYLKKQNLNRLSIHRSAPVVPDVSGVWLIYGEAVNKSNENTEASIFKPESHADLIYIEQNGNSCSVRSTVRSGDIRVGMITPEGNMMVCSNPKDNSITTFNFQKNENDEVIGLTGVYSNNETVNQVRKQSQTTDNQEQTVNEEENHDVNEFEVQTQPGSVGYFFAEKVNLDNSAVKKAKKMGLLPHDY